MYPSLSQVLGIWGDVADILKSFSQKGKEDFEKKRQGMSKECHLSGLMEKMNNHRRE